MNHIYLIVCRKSKHVTSPSHIKHAHGSPFIVYFDKMSTKGQDHDTGQGS